MSDTDPTSDVATLTVQLLSAYLANNTVASGELAELIRSTRAALTEEDSAPAAEIEMAAPTPAVSVRKSLASPDHIISLIDGKSYKTLKRHLASHGLTPESYRARYQLPASYPMVAPTYAAHRRAVAQKIGLGSRKPAVAAAEDLQDTAALAPADAPEIAATSTPDVSEPAQRPAKAQTAPRGRKKADQDDAAPRAKSAKRVKAARESTPSEAPSSTDDSSASSPAESSATPKGKPAKPRGKIGLFRKDAQSSADTQNEAPSPTGADAGESAPAQSGAKTGAKPGRPKRMARAAKPSAA